METMEKIVTIFVRKEIKKNFKKKRNLKILKKNKIHKYNIKKKSKIKYKRI